LIQRNRTKGDTVMNDVQMLLFLLTIMGASAVVIIAGTVLTFFLRTRSERPNRLPTGSRPYSHPFGPMLHRR